MAQNISNNFSEVFPKHPHRRVRILLVILSFVVVVSLVVLYQLNKVPKDPPLSPEVVALNKQLASLDLNKQKPLTTEEANRLLRLLDKNDSSSINATSSINKK